MQRTQLTFQNHLTKEDFQVIPTYNNLLHHRHGHNLMCKTWVLLKQLSQVVLHLGHLLLQVLFRGLLREKSIRKGKDD